MEERSRLGGPVDRGEVVGQPDVSFDPSNPYPSVGIVTVNWNGWKDTLEFLDSATRLTYPNFKIVVVDNGSSDESEPRLRSKFPTIGFVQTGRNLGYPGGANAGIRVILDGGAEYIWLINNDTVIDKDALTAMVEVVRGHSDIGLVGSIVYHYHDRERIQF